MGWSDVFLFTNQFLNANKPFVKFRSRIRGHPLIWIEPNLTCGWVWSNYKMGQITRFLNFFLSARKYLLNKHYSILYAYSYSRTYVSSVHFIRCISRFPALNCIIYTLWNDSRFITFPESPWLILKEMVKSEKIWIWNKNFSRLSQRCWNFRDTSANARYAKSNGINTYSWW